MKAESGLLLAVPGDCCACFSLSLVETMAASVVLPGGGQRVGGLKLLCMSTYQILECQILQSAIVSTQEYLGIFL
jgi:hypothetical protein